MTAFFALLPALVWAALQPRLAPPGEYHVDKLVHVSAFALLACLGWTASSRTWARTAALALLSATGALVEALQAVVPGRSANWTDWLADNVGIATGLLVVGLLTMIQNRGPSDAFD